MRTGKVEFGVASSQGEVKNPSGDSQEPADEEGGQGAALRSWRIGGTAEAR